LAERFFSCRTALKLLDSERFIKPLFIDAQNIPGARSYVDYEKSTYNPNSAEIVIPEKQLQSATALRDLAFEIFNTQSSSPSLYKQAELGNVGMDAYARQREEQETADTQEHHKLIKQCAKQWKLSPKTLEEYSLKENENLEVVLFRDEYVCHTDRYRQEWIDRFQKIYCDKHPDDFGRSCKTKKKDLCDQDKLLSMSLSKRSEFAFKRACKLFPQAHENVKNDPDTRKMIQRECPEVLEKKSSNQAIKKDL
jgi:hypothetical protein